MDFRLNDDQRLLKESIDRFLSEQYGFPQRARRLEQGRVAAEEVWRQFAEMGLLGLPFSEVAGGLGLGPVEIMLVMEAFGRSLVVEPYLPTVIVAGGLVALAGTDVQQREVLSAVAAGEKLAALAHAESGARYDLDHVATTARREGDGWVLDGSKRFVLGGDHADLLVVSARVSGEVDDPLGIALFLVDPSSSGIARRSYRLQDNTGAADVRLSQVRVGHEALLAEPGSAGLALKRVVARAIAALCAEAVGAMDAALSLTLEHIKTRKQFGATLGSFQALQHRAVDMYVELELARSMTMHATVAASSDDPDEAMLAASAAKAQMGKAMASIGKEAIQMHGGIGMTEEYPVGHYYRRLTMIETQFGDTSHHIGQVATAGGLIEAAEHAVL